MKICSIIAEYNPLHNGHLRQINYVKENSSYDYLAVFLSGNFTQRGEGAILNKFTRASHAIKAGADIVFELPSVFATQSAEIFASGALKLINSLPGDKTICFGAECGDKNKIIKTALALLNETEEYKKVLKEELKNGVSLLKARETALIKTAPDIDAEVLKQPNNVLGIEYVKAILKNNYDIEIDVIDRKGSDYNDSCLSNAYPSALAIRSAIENNNLESVKDFVPNFVYNDLPKKLHSFDREIIYSLLSSSKKDIAKTVDCAEGLENRIKALVRENFTLLELTEKLSTKRYTTKRLQRIMLSTMLKIDKKLVQTALKKSLYLKVLAVNSKNTKLLSQLSKSKYPLITRKSDCKKLSGIALEVFEKDVFANDIYSAVTNNKTNEFNMIIE